jgi:hypothetical protein
MMATPDAAVARPAPAEAGAPAHPPAEVRPAARIERDRRSSQHLTSMEARQPRRGAALLDALIREHRDGLPAFVRRRAGHIVRVPATGGDRVTAQSVSCKASSASSVVRQTWSP